MNKLAHIEAIDRGSGLQHILDSAYAILNMPLVLFDTRYTLLARAGEVDDDPIWKALITSGAHSVETQKFFADENFYDQIANTDTHFVVKSKNLKHSRMMGYIYNSEKIKVAILAMFETGAPFSPEDSSVFLKLSDILSETIYNDMRYTKYGRDFHEEMITLLLDRAIKNRFLFTPNIQILYDGFSEYLYVAVVEAAGRAPDALIDIKDILMGAFKAYKFAVYSGYIVMLMSSRYMIAFEELFADRFIDLFGKHNLYAGISDSFENPYDIRDYYDKAVAALISGKEKNIAQRIY